MMIGVSIIIVIFMVNRAFDWIKATLISSGLISVSQVIALFILGAYISKVNKDNPPKGSIYVTRYYNLYQ